MKFKPGDVVELVGPLAGAIYSFNGVITSKPVWLQPGIQGIVRGYRSATDLRVGVSIEESKLPLWGEEWLFRLVPPPVSRLVSWQSDPLLRQIRESSGREMFSEASLERALVEIREHARRERSESR